MDLSGLAADASVAPENKAEQYAKAAEQLAQSSVVISPSASSLVSAKYSLSFAALGLALNSLTKS